MKKYVTILSCLIFLAIGFYTPVYAASVVTPSPATSSFFESNFACILFIALIVVFFLLGLTLGLIIDPPKRTHKERKKAGGKALKDKPKETDTLGQDNPQNENNQDRGVNSRDPRNRYYNNFW